jgi:uncharacterized membrane protein
MAYPLPVKGGRETTTLETTSTPKGGGLTNRKIAGLIFLALGAIAVVAACLLASGRFGGGPMGFAAGGIIAGSIPLFIIAAYLFFSHQNEVREVKTGIYDKN